MTRERAEIGRVVAFIAKLEEPVREEPRGARRWIIRAPGRLGVGDRRLVDVIIHDISETGFLAEFASDLTAGAPVRLQLGRGHFAAAHVVWKRGAGHGCEFTAPISAERITATRARAVALYATGDGTAAAQRPSGRGIGITALGLVTFGIGALLWLR